MAMSPFGTACRGALPADAPGASLGTPSLDTHTRSAEVLANKSEQREPLAWFREALSWPAAGPAFQSLGHYGGKYRGLVRVSPDGLDTYRQRAPSALEGTKIVLFLGEEGQRGPVLAMEKDNATWTFRALTPDGRPEGGHATSLCERCHADAPRDYTFGPPISGENGTKD